MLLTVFLALWVALLALHAMMTWYYVRDIARPYVPATDEPVAVIVPVKGAAAALEPFLAAMLAQDYPQYRVIAAVQSADDSAFPVLVGCARHHPGRLQVVAAGLAQAEGQKVRNLLAGVDAVGTDAGILAFADQDMVPPRHWITRLVRLIVRDRAEIATGYRWLVPANRHPASHVAAAIHSLIAAIPQVPAWTLPWGGSVALRRRTFEALRVREAWRGALSDDLQLRAAAVAGHARIRRVRELLVPSPVAFDWRSLLEFGTRQYRILFRHRPGYWALSAGSNFLVLTGWMLALAELGQGSAIGIAAAAAGQCLTLARSLAEVKLVRALWGAEMLRACAASICLGALAQPLLLAVNGLMQALAPLSRVIRWSGVTYRIDAPQRITIVERSDIAAKNHTLNTC